MIKIIFCGLLGFASSQVFYPLTHGKGRKYPETAGLVIGGLDVLAAMSILNAGEKAIRTAALALAAVGVGVGFSRLLLMGD